MSEGAHHKTGTGETLFLDHAGHSARNDSCPKKRTLSAEARKKIAAAQKKRWAKQRTAKPVQITKIPAK
jgi:hypothetical protein